MLCQKVSKGQEQKEREEENCCYWNGNVPKTPMDRGRNETKEFPKQSCYFIDRRANAADFKLFQAAGIIFIDKNNNLLEGTRSQRITHFCNKLI